MAAPWTILGMPTMPLAWFVGFALTLGVPLAAQQVLTVGPGQTFATITAAVAAAAPGDTVLVNGGSYQETLDIDKPLQVVSRGARLRPVALFGPSIRIHDLGPNQPVVLRGFTLESGTGAFLPITVDRCEGPVTLHDLDNQGGAERWTLGVNLSTQVHVARALLFAVRATASVVALERCVVEPTAGSMGIWSLGGSAISCSLCTVQGASILPFAAVRIENGGSLVVTRSSLSGGSGSSGSTGQPAIDAPNGAAVLVDPSSSLNTAGPGPAVVGTVPAVLPLTSLSAASNGTVATVNAHGPANEVFVTVFSAVAPAVATPLGLTWLDLGTFTPLYAGVFDPVTRQHVATIPHGTAPAGQTIALQSIVLGSGGLSLGLPTVLSMP